MYLVYNRVMAFSKGYTPWNKKETNTEYILCACGCGGERLSTDSRGRPAKFIYGHGNRGRKMPNLKHDGQFKKGNKPHNKGISGYSNNGTFKCGHAGMAAEHNPMWKGGTSTTKAGYVVDNHTKKYVHRIVMESKMGRKLLPNEHVHHINHDRGDNSPDNLVILSPEEHGRYHAKHGWEIRKG